MQSAMAYKGITIEKMECFDLCEGLVADLLFHPSDVDTQTKSAYSGQFTSYHSTSVPCAVSASEEGTDCCVNALPSPKSRVKSWGGASLKFQGVTPDVFNCVEEATSPLLSNCNIPVDMTKAIPDGMIALNEVSIAAASPRT